MVGFPYICLPQLQRLNKLQLSRVLMIATIAIIACFQGYWLNRLYLDEKQSLKKEADVLFRESVYNLQMQKFSKDTFFQEFATSNRFLMDAMNAIRRNAKGPLGKKMVITMSNSFSKTTDSSRKDSALLVTSVPEKDIMIPRMTGAGDVSRVVFRSSLGDSLSVPQVDSAYGKELRKAKINVGYIIFSMPVKQSPRNFTDSVNENALHTNYVIVGLSNPVAYQAQLESPFNYILGKITYPILVSLLLITLTTVSFIFLYRNLLAQQRLTSIKNDFISNITHELKTPIATVNVAIEALRSFNAMDNPARTKEYLDISSAELQRLSLLVDKVLKLSMFENRDIELKRETFSMKQVIEEVLQTMQLQFDKAKASVQFNTEGERFMVEADKLHITSVVYNLVDNALKYSPAHPQIDILLTDRGSFLQARISDKGIGIPKEYQHRVFEKFFRVPHGDTHNIKGYGLGLSYVSHIIEKHHGSIEVESEEGKGSTFVINLPVTGQAVIDDGNGKKISRK